VQLQRDQAKFEAAGVRLAFVGMGTPAMAEDFRKQFKITLPILIDRKREAYRAAGTKVGGVTDLLGPKVVAKGLLATARTGVVQGRTRGNAAQLGGVLIVKPDGTIPYAHLAEDASDNPHNAKVLAAARAAAKAA
jgi:peroxiredoxin